MQDARTNSQVGTIIATGDTSQPRSDHTATLLPNGKVLITGGMAQNGAFAATAELYDPSIRQFTSADHMNWKRAWGSTAVLLANGKVLIAGGSSAPQCGTACDYLRSAEIYGPDSGSFTPTGDMVEGRAVLVSARLRNGDVLVVGGSDPSGPAPVATAELYHPSSGSFSLTGSMRVSRGVLAAVTLKSGNVLVIGQNNTNGVIEQATAEVYDPATGTFSATGKMRVPRTKLGAALMADGRVLVIGGQIGGPRGERLSSSEIYDPAVGTFSTGPEMNFKRFKLPRAVVALSNGRILIAGGAEQPEVFDPATGAFTIVGGAKLDTYSFSTATALANGEVLIVGGYGRPQDDAVNHAWIYRP